MSYMTLPSQEKELKNPFFTQIVVSRIRRHYFSKYWRRMHRRPHLKFGENVSPRYPPLPIIITHHIHSSSSPLHFIITYHHHPSSSTSSHSPSPSSYPSKSTSAQTSIAYPDNYYYHHEQHHLHIL